MSTEQTPKDVLIDQLGKWIDDLGIGTEKADFHINTGQKIDPKEGVLSQAFIIRVDRKMEKVENDPEKVGELPPIPKNNQAVAPVAEEEKE